MLQAIVNPILKIFSREMKQTISGFYRVRIVNRSKDVIWLAKNTIGDLHDIIPSGRSLEIRLPVAQKMKFYAYKASSNMVVTGLNYYDKKEFTREETWIIQ